MPLFQLAIIAIVQGVTEFLPVSSSAHLILVPMVLGTADQGLAIDVAVHMGTLGAVLLFFRREVAAAVRGIGHILTGRTATPEARLALLLAVASVPVVIAGLVLQLTGLTQAFRSLAVIGWTLLGFGLFLYWADQRGPQMRTVGDWNLRDAVVMGLWQALALIPGTSRSGITITASRLLGFRREDGARIAMLMSIPTVMASGVLLAGETMAHADWALMRAAGIGAVLALGAAYMALSLMLRLLRSHSYTPFVIYRVVLGLVLLAIAYG